MRRFIFLVLVFNGTLAVGQVKPSIYFNKDAGAEKHRTIAILPFYCIADSADFAGGPAYQPVQERALGFEYQQILYTRMQAFHGSFSVSIQDVYVTNGRLRALGINDLRFADMKAIAAALHVDAVMWVVVTHSPVQFKEDEALRQLLHRQHIPEDVKRKDLFLSLFDAQGDCFFTLAVNSEFLRNLLYFENARIQFFVWMQELPYWKGNKIGLL